MPDPTPNAAPNSEPDRSTDVTAEVVPARRTTPADLIMTFLLGRVADPDAPAASPHDMRRKLETVTRIVPPPTGVRVRQGIVAGVRGRWLEPLTPTEAGIHVHLHGGAYVAGASRTEAGLGAGLARRLRRATFLPDYRLAPEHVFPAALDDAVAVLRALTPHAGGHLTLSGSSAGGGLAAAALLALRDADWALPQAAALVAPWADLTPHAGDRDPQRPRDRSLHRASLHAAADAYAPDDRANPYVSPVLGDFTGVGPCLIQVGTADLLLPDARKLAAAMRRTGVTVQLEEWTDRQHVFSVFPGPDHAVAVRSLAGMLAAPPA